MGSRGSFRCVSTCHPWMWCDMCLRRCRSVLPARPPQVASMRYQGCPPIRAPACAHHCRRSCCRCHPPATHWTNSIPACSLWRAERATRLRFWATWCSCLRRRRAATRPQSSSIWLRWWRHLCFQQPTSALSSRLCDADGGWWADGLRLEDREMVEEIANCTFSQYRIHTFLYWCSSLERRTHHTRMPNISTTHNCLNLLQQNQTWTEKIRSSEDNEDN